jgi:hypothetical protein
MKEKIVVLFIIVIFFSESIGAQMCGVFKTLKKDNTSEIIKSSNTGKLIDKDRITAETSSRISTNNWYVGNTTAGEWIQFRQVWLSEGDYRFTTRSVASKSLQTVHLELNGQALSERVEIPSNTTGEFELI